MSLNKQSIKMLLKNESGIGLIEVIAAVAISVIVITALVSLALYTLRSATNSRMLLEGTKLANTEMELVRAVRDLTTEYSDFYDTLIANCSGTNVCHVDVSRLSEANVNSGNMFQDVILSGEENFQISTPNPNEDAVVQVSFNADDSDGDQVIRVVVTANWNAGQVQSTTLQSDFSNWRNR
jgi:Tfp pilus assembly protein PilV